MSKPSNSASVREPAAYTEGMVRKMSACSFDNLVKLLDKQLNLDEKLGVYDHLDNCDTCRDTIYHIKRDRDEAALLFRPIRVKKLSVA